MADENFDALNTLAQNQRQLGQNDKQSAPFFLDEAEKIPFELQSFVADYKRQINQKLSPDNLLWAVGEEVADFEVKNGQVMPVLKMRVEENAAPVYVFASQAGSNYSHLDNFIDQRVKVAITTFLDAGTKDKDGNEQYIALGSIQQAEFVINGLLYQAMLKDPDAVKNKDRIGKITQVIDTPDFRFISFEYQGAELGMLAKNFYYQTWTKPLSQVAYIGMKFPFRITNIIKAKYEDQEGVKKDIAEGRPVPKGLMYQVLTTRLLFLESPDKDVESKFERGADFKGYIVQYHPIMGILVEVAPGWWCKGILSANSPIKPSIADAQQHTPVIVHLEKINPKTRTGRAWIKRFPHGVVRVPDPHEQ
ncbi:hypothetical protein [Lactobacillus crispatus]|uniref:hypothetical protein n=1 Tax=Lactobacillus crispatus TaxID=47770 RepID=UPI000E065DC0|nr:hypothetical protein [Lactobacillus crispatus]STX18421.1 Uncharacterised protein [Lactobacillus acidophilus]MCT7696902.1 hypothetical protein [Lactobacillus crispatus]MCT7708377.1 hypothetical protein [Lactobacillus crispatus]MCT7730778.1 hypothetical protein [Lactobacillus crispatus]MCT7802160.1 hypothetical protein [Lactobacillus crispatus]